jgi:hypothetical protein
MVCLDAYQRISCNFPLRDGALPIDTDHSSNISCMTRGDWYGMSRARLNASWRYRWNFRISSLCRPWRSKWPTIAISSHEPRVPDENAFIFQLHSFELLERTRIECYCYGLCWMGVGDSVVFSHFELVPATVMQRRDTCDIS